MVGYHVANTLSEFGSVSRGVCRGDASSHLVDVVERTHIERGPAGIAFRDEHGEFQDFPGETIVSMNFWGFTPSLFSFLNRAFSDFIRKNSENLKAEFFIPSMVNELINTRQATVKILDCHDKWFGMTYKEDRETVVRSIRELVRQGIYPENLWG